MNELTSSAPDRRARSRIGVGSMPLIAAMFVGGCSAPQEGRQMPSTLVEGTPMYDVLPLDGIPAIDEPVFVGASDVDGWMQPDEMVLGVVGSQGTAKAYSAWQLDSHEIVNDELDGQPIAATW